MEVSPFLIDIEGAYENGGLDQMMGYLNALRPALHVSIIETALPLEQIAQHLRKFIFILDPEEKQFTLRYADCAVLAPLSSLLTASQWAAMRGPMTQWEIHNRSGAIIQLGPVESDTASRTPLSLDQGQWAALDEASEPDHFIAKVKMMRHGDDLPGRAAEQHAWAHGARQLWKAAPNLNPLFLLFLTETALITRGDALRRKEIPNFLAMDEVSAFRERLRETFEQTQ